MTKKMTLISCEKNKLVKVLDIFGSNKFKAKLLEAGFTPGCVVAVVAKLPNHGPLAITFRGTIFALRENEAKCVKCEYYEEKDG